MTYQSGQPLPDKLYFRIGEVSDIVGVKPYVLRYWETEFSDIKPTKSKSGQRLYRKRDVELLLKIRGLLYSERFTINGAKQRLKEGAKPAVAAIPATAATIQEAAQKVVQEVFKEAKEEVMQDDLFVQHEVVQVKEKVVEVPKQVEVTTSNVGRKFLEKMKTDLEWCLTEIRSG